MNKELYKNKIKEFCSLMNVNDLSQKPTAQAIFERVNGRFTDDDMIRAFDDMVESEVTKLTYPTLKKFLMKYREIRVSADIQRRKSQERSGIEDIMSHAEIKELIDNIIHKKPGAVSVSFFKSNSVVLTKDGRRLDVWINPYDPNLEPGKAVTIVYEQKGEYTIRTQHINLGMVDHKILTRRAVDMVGGRGSEQVALPMDEDFIPELEVPDNAFQGTLGLDRQAGGDAG